MEYDLAKSHDLITELFPKLDPAEAWQKYALTDEQLRSFDVNGYVSDIQLLDDYQIDQLNNELEELQDPSHPRHHLFYEFHSNESGDPDSVLFHSLGHWRITQGFHDILWNPRFVVAASQLLGNRSVRFWHDQLFCKPAHHGGVVAWHQDYSYWTRTVPMQHLTCWTALDDASRENGCLCYVPGSHRWGLLEKPDLAGDMMGLEKYLNEDQKEQFANKVFIELRRGYGTFHHPLMVHGSYENRSGRARRAFVINVFADGTISDSDEPLLQGVPPTPRGNKLEGTYFPLLYKP